ncbi:MAG TPA: cobalamin-dependent protein, partial [Dehalococcoidales bacterium]|nr:cobalamin-dependent protein [Dehalococcoidales bacterium]
MKVVLLNPRLRTWSPNVYVPLGLTYIAAVLQKEGHHVRIIDLNVEKIGDDSLKGILADAGIAGITGMITEYAEVIRVADLVKGAKDGLTVVLGGPLASTFPRELLEASRADLAVIGEGERTAVALVAAIEKRGDLHNINGLAFKKDDKIEFTGPVEPITDLDSVPFPARDLLDMRRYLRDHF